MERPDALAYVLRTLCGVFCLIHNSLSLADFHGTLTGTTNNADRWFTKSDNDVALLANIDYEHSSGLYIGSSVSNINFKSAEVENNPAHVEITPYVGWSFELPEQWRLALQWTGYLYDGNLFGHAADYHEFYGFLHYRDLLTARVAVTDNYYSVGNYAIDYALTGRYLLTDALQLSATAGYAQTNAALGSDYPYWNVGLVYAYKFITLALHYMDATETNIDLKREEIMHAAYDPPMLDAAVVFSISTGF
ncbi:MAG: TorF family putative porin [Methylococcales bacterium]